MWRKCSSRPSPGARRLFIPSFRQLPDAAALTIAVGIIGATVMPHAIYLHSGLTQGRVPTKSDDARRRLVRFSNIEVVVALTVAGLVNMAMVMMAAAAFHAGHSDVAEIETAYHTLTPLLGPAAAGIFLVSLLASGISSSAVGTMAGQMIMQGFVGFRIPVWLRRLLTMIPAFVVVALGVNATQSLVLSQVVLSHRFAGADDRTGLVHPPRRYHGTFCQRPIDRFGSYQRHDHHPRLKYRPAVANLRRPNSRVGIGLIAAYALFRLASLSSLEEFLYRFRRFLFLSRIVDCEKSQL